MQSLCRFRKFVVLAALVWLPMNVFAQVCATQCLVMSMQSTGAFSQSEDSAAAKLGTTLPTPSPGNVNASFASAESAVHDCDMKAVCAFAALVPLTGAQQDAAISTAQHSIPATTFRFASYRSIADTPPPRTAL